MPKRKTKENPYKKRVRVYGGAGRLLAKDLMYLKTVINSEMHHFTQPLTRDLDDVGTVEPLNIIAQGDGVINRTGTSILPRFQSINFYITKNLAGPNHEAFRVIVFRYWGEASSVIPSVSVSEVLQDVNCLSFLNDDNTGSKGDRERRIEVHKSVLFTLDNVATTSRTFKWNITVNGLAKNIKDHIKYRSSNEEQPISGGFYMLIISDNSSFANKSEINLNAKINFYDN